MARILQALRIKRKQAKNTKAKYTISYKRVVKTKEVTQNGITSKYTYITYEKVITPKQNLSYGKG